MRTFSDTHFAPLLVSTSVYTCRNVNVFRPRSRNLYLRLMHARLTLLFMLMTVAASAQVTNSTSKDKTGLYTHALDSMISLIKEDTVLHKIYMLREECVRNAIPDTLQDVVIGWSTSISRDKLKSGEMMMLINCLSIIRNEVIIQIASPRRGDWAYRFQYYYQPDTRHYLLKRIDRGLRL